MSQTMSLTALEKALAPARKVRHVMVATVGESGEPHVAAAVKLADDANGRVAV